MRSEAMKGFVALIHHEPDGTYRVSFPDFPSVMAGDDTLEHVRVRAEYALFHHIGRRMAERP
jgi:predicted RNase H-like HicB family nuclease